MFDKPDFNPHFKTERRCRKTQLWITVNLTGVLSAI
jgi:hypothetical protein